MDEVHKPEKYKTDKTELKRVARQILRGYLKDAREEAIKAFSSTNSFFGFSTPEERAEAISSLDYVIFETPEHQFGQDTDASESVLERLRREFKDKFQAPLEEVAGKVGMLENLKFHKPKSTFSNDGLPEIGCLTFEGIIPQYTTFNVHFEIGVKERIGKEARFEFPEVSCTKHQYRSIPDAFKELVRILEEQGQMIPKI